MPHSRNSSACRPLAGRNFAELVEAGDRAAGAGTDRATQLQGNAASRRSNCAAERANERMAELLRQSACRRRRHALSGGCLRTEGAGDQIRPVAEDAGGRPAGRRRGARLQQSSHRHHRQLRIPADAPSGGRSLLQGNQRGAPERAARRRTGEPASGLQPQADHAAQGAGAGRCDRRTGADAAPAVGRRHRP